MEDAELTRFIRNEVRRQLNVILNAEAGDNDGQTEVVQKLYPGMPATEPRPVVHPYGMVSRAPRGTISVTARAGDHPGNRMVMGHRDKSRPQVSEGEVMLYNSSGEQVYVKDGDIIMTAPKVHIGSDAAKEPFVLGLVFRQFMSDVLQLIEEHTHECSVPGGESGVPLNQLDFEDKRQDPIENSAILSDKIFGEKG